MSEERLVRIERKVEALELGQVDLGRQMQRVEHDLSRQMQTLHDDLGRQMRVLHEETLDRIAALAPDFGPIRREFTEADAKLREDLTRRIDPIEAVIRNRGTGG